MFGASAWSPRITFFSFGTSLTSVGASRCCRWPASYQTARQRPPSERAGQTVIPHSSSITSPPPRVDSRPVPIATTAVRAGAAAFLARRQAGRARFGPVVGILVRAGAACVMTLALFLPLSQVRGLTDDPWMCGQGRGRTADLPLFRRTLVPTELPDQDGGLAARKGTAERADLSGPDG